MSSIKYRPEIDGLRALAVIPVVLFHLGLEWMSGGFVGVDVFFVISGFLITSIILKEQAAGTFTFKGFWMRRIKRIMPAMITVLLTTAVAGYLLMFGPDWLALGRQIVAVLLLYANVEMWQLSGDYWGPGAESSALLHTWSLSVEEQFYLFYPLILIGLLKFAPKFVFKAVLLGTIASFAICIYGTWRSPSATFYLLPTRAWELAAGCLLAIAMSSSTKSDSAGSKTPWQPTLGFALIVAGYFLINGSDGFPGFKALLPVVGTVLIIAYGASCECWVTRALAASPVVYIGKISYSLYLWHWPVIVLGKAMKLRFPDAPVLLASIVLIPLLSVLSYHLVERPARRAKRILWPIAIGVVACLLMAGLLIQRDYKYDFSFLKPTVAMGASYDVGPRPAKSGGLLGVTGADRTPEQASAFSENGILKSYGGDHPRVVFLGSSHGMMWAKTIDDICQQLNSTVSFFTVRAVPPLIEFPIAPRASSVFTALEKRAFDENRLAKIKLWQPRLVILCDRWSVRDNLEKYNDFIKFCGVQNARVLILEQPPEVRIGTGSVPAFLSHQYSIADGKLDAETHVEFQNHASIDRANKAMRDIAAAHDNCFTVNVSERFLNNEQDVIIRNGKELLYIDDNHLSEAGARLVKENLADAIRSILTPDATESPILP